MSETPFLSLPSPRSSGFGSNRSHSSLPTSTHSSSLVFTLPISCQICLSKVKDPVICCNRHVFCKQCMDVWLQRNGQCPACRVEVNEANPCRSILGGLSVTDENEDENDDVEAGKQARNSKKNLRKARIELLFNEYEEEIEELREEVRTLRESNVTLDDALRRAQATALPNGQASATPRDPDTSAMLVSLTSKLQEANDTYQRVLKDMDSLKKENSKLKSERENLDFEVQGLRARLQHRSPAKMGRYATVAMESELSAARQETERLKKALAFADDSLEKMQEEQEHLKAFHKNCLDHTCPLKDGRLPIPTTVTDSPSTSIGALTLSSPLTTIASRPAANVAKCMRNLFSDDGGGGQKEANSSKLASTTTPRPSPQTILSNGTKHSENISNNFKHPEAFRQPLSIPSKQPSSNFNLSTRFSLPSPALASKLVATSEAEADLDASLDADVRDCLSLMQAAERKVKSRSEGSGSAVSEGAASFREASTSSLPNVSAYAAASRSPSEAAAASPSAFTNSTAISLASSPLSPTLRDDDEDDTFSLPSRSEIRTLKRDLSQAELPSKKNLKF